MFYGPENLTDASLLDLEGVCQSGEVLHVRAAPWLLGCLEEIEEWMPAPLDCLPASMRPGWREMWRPQASPTRARFH